MDSIDTNNKQFIQVVDKLKKLDKSYKITIVGGASAVGSKNGYNNNKLAQRRCNNFISALNKYGIDTSSYYRQFKVGVATVKNSPEANDEQFVKIIAKQSNELESAIDNTAVEKPGFKQKIPIGNDVICIKVSKLDVNKATEILRKNNIKIY